MKVTKHKIEYRPACLINRVTTIPKGTDVTQASNLPDDLHGQARYWVEPWEGMTDEQEAWQRNYGYLLNESEVEDVGLTGVSLHPADLIEDASKEYWLVCEEDRPRSISTNSVVSLATGKVTHVNQLPKPIKVIDHVQHDLPTLLLQLWT